MAFKRRRKRKWKEEDISKLELKEMRCQQCYRIVPRVSGDAENVLCWKCTMMLAAISASASNAEKQEKKRKRDSTKRRKDKNIHVINY